MLAEKGENAPVYRFLPYIKNAKLSKAYFIPFDFRKGKTDKLVVPAQSYN